MDERERFWSEITVPTNPDWEEDGTSFVNPVHVSDMFATVTGVSSHLSWEAEILTEELANLDFELRQEEREWLRLRRAILVDHFQEIKASWGSEVLEAFIIHAAGERLEELLAVEERIAELKTSMAAIKPRLEKLAKRLHAVNKNMEFAKQWLDYDKLLQRINGGGWRV